MALGSLLAGSRGEMPSARFRETAAQFYGCGNSTTSRSPYAICATPRHWLACRNGMRFANIGFAVEEQQRGRAKKESQSATIARSPPSGSRQCSARCGLFHMIPSPNEKIGRTGSSTAKQKSPIGGSCSRYLVHTFASNFCFPITHSRTSQPSARRMRAKHCVGCGFYGRACRTGVSITVILMDSNVL